MDLDQQIETYTPYSDLQTRNLVFQRMQFEDTKEDFKVNERDYNRETINEFLSDEGISVPENETNTKVIDILEKKGREFKHTSEYYAAIKDQNERAKAYRSVVVSNSLVEGEQGEIRKNPLKFLGLSEDATFAQVRATWIRLSNFWSPDMMFPESTKRLEAIFGDSPNLFGGYDWKGFVEEGPPNFLSVKKLESLSIQERDAYRKSQEDFREQEVKYESVKNEMRQRATNKMQFINFAYEEAKKRFSAKEQESFAGFAWEKGELNSDVTVGLGSFGPLLEYLSLKLEGQGEIRKDTGKYAFDNNPYLAYDFGEIWMCDNGYRQALPLRAFFAWMELIQQRSLSPQLLEDLVKQYKFNEDQSEQLRLMIMNREPADFISETLEIPLPEIDKEGYIKNWEFLKNNPQKDSRNLTWFASTAYEGPLFQHTFRNDDGQSYLLGVEFTLEGKMILKYQSQSIQCGWEIFHWTREDQAQFTPTDLKIMRAIAYGPLLQETN